MPEISHPSSRAAPHAPARESGDPATRSAATSPLVTFETFHDAARPGAGTDPGWSRHRLTRLDAVFAVMLFIGALAARSPFITKGETLLHSDEAIVGLMAQDIAEGRGIPVYFYGQRYMGSLEALVIAGLTFVFDNPVVALRAGPALFLAALVTAQFLMLTRWFGRRGGLIGASALIFSSPMFMQWSISARGAYIEILLWGSLVLWSYTEWFLSDIEPNSIRQANRRRLLFGLLIGSGLWLNPLIVLFVAPVILHAIFDRPLRAASDSRLTGPLLKRLSSTFGNTTLLVAALSAILTLNLTWTVWVSDHKVRTELLLGLVPRFVAIGLYACAAMTAVLYLRRKTGLIGDARSILTRNAAMIIGLVVGAAPAVLYTLQAAIGARPLDPSLPLGFRPLWMTGETLIYLFTGLPLLFGADPRLFLQLVGTGRDTVVTPLNLIDSALVVAANWLVAGCLISMAVIFIYQERAGFTRLLRMQPLRHSPGVLLAIAVASTLTLYILGGCTLDFTTIRYLVPLWVFLPGILAAIYTSERFRLSGTVVAFTLLVAWGFGQIAMNGQLGAPHPLRATANRLVAQGIDPAVAEPLDAHLLSYLTRQKCRTIEFESFWPRLSRYHTLLQRNEPTDYVVQTAEIDRTWDWIRGGWPGEAPPETRRFLWPRLRRLIDQHPEAVIERVPLSDGYERIRLKSAMMDRTIFKPRRQSAAADAQKNGFARHSSVD